MALNTPAGALRPSRRVFHDSHSARQVTVTIPEGAELEVPAVVADQLEATSTHFKSADAPKPAAKKAPAKKAAVKK